MPGNMLSWLLSILTLCSEASGPKREKVSPAGSSLDVGMGLHLSFICPCWVPQELTKDLDLPVPRGSPQLPAPAGPWRWHSLEETQERKPDSRVTLPGSIH